MAELAAKVTGSIDAPNIDATVTVAEGTLLDQTIADASVRFEGAPTEGGWQGTLTLGGTLAGQPLAGTARAEVADGGLSFPDINLTIAENRITGALAQTGEGLLSGSLDVEASNLKTLAAMALVEATGSASARATFTPENGRQGLAVNFAARDVAVDTVAAGQVEGEARIDDLFGAPTIAGRADLGSVAVGSLAIDTAMVSAEVVRRRDQLQGLRRGSRSHLGWDRQPGGGDGWPDRPPRHSRRHGLRLPRRPRRTRDGRRRRMARRAFPT